MTIDALRFPRTDDPYKSYKVPAIDPASWVADLAIAAYWNEVFVAEGRPGLAKARFVILTGARDEQALVKKIFDAATLDIATFFAWSAHCRGLPPLKLNDDYSTIASPVLPSAVEQSRIYFPCASQPSGLSYLRRSISHPEIDSRELNAFQAIDVLLE